MSVEMDRTNGYSYGDTNAKREPKAPKPGSTLLKRVYIWEKDPDLIAYPDTSSMENGDVIGTYNLVEISRAVVKATLEPVK